MHTITKGFFIHQSCHLVETPSITWLAILFTATENIYSTIPTGVANLFVLPYNPCDPIDRHQMWRGIVMANACGEVWSLFGNLKFLVGKLKTLIHVKMKVVKVGRIP